MKCFTTFYSIKSRTTELELEPGLLDYLEPGQIGAAPQHCLEARNWLTVPASLGQSAVRLSQYRYLITLTHLFHCKPARSHKISTWTWLETTKKRFFFCTGTVCVKKILCEEKTPGFLAFYPVRYPTIGRPFVWF